MWLYGANDDDTKLLLLKRFVLPFESGIIVIKHWRMHNLLRKDRYKPTEYVDEKSMLYLKENGSYTFDETQGKSLMATSWQPNNNQMATQDSIGKDSSNSLNSSNNIKKELPIKSNSQDCFNNNGSSQKETQKDENQSESDKDNTTSLSLVETPKPDKTNKTDTLKAKEKENYVFELFDKTWSIYPHKTGKEQAKKTWLKKFNSLNTKELIREKALKIYALLEKHIASWKTEVDGKGRQGRPKQFIPHFSTWLNNEIPTKE